MIEKPRLRARRCYARDGHIALLVVVGLASVGLGFAADGLAMHNRRGEIRPSDAEEAQGLARPEARRGRQGMGPGGGRRGEGMREGFARQLDLTPEQQRRVDSIMEQQMVDFRRIREQMQPRVDSLLARAQTRLDSALTPTQREKLKTLRARDAFGPRDGFGMRELPPPPFP